jgi:hypothetical protein
MTIESVTLHPPYSTLFISDIDLALGEPFNGRHIVWNDRCVSITCLNWQDGPTTVSLCTASKVAAAGAPAFDGEIGTPNREVAVATAEDEIVLRMKVGSAVTRVRIWENRPGEPDQIVIGLG